MRTTLPMNLVLSPTAIPCELEILGDTVKWKPTGKAKVLQEHEIETAMWHLGETIAIVGHAGWPEEALRQKFTGEKLASILEEKASLKALKEYSAIYGRLYPKTEVKLPKLRQYCYHLGFIITLYNLAIEGSPLALAFVYLLRAQDVDAPYLKLETGEDGSWHWLPCKKKPSGLYFVNPKILDSYEQALAYVKEQASRILAQHLSEWPVRFKAAATGLEGHITHLLPYYLVGLLTLELHPCPCGCGRLVQEGKKYFEEGCYRKLLNRQPHRKIASWLRTMKVRKKLTEEQYHALTAKAKEMLEEGYTEAEVRQAIEALIR